MFAAVPLSAVIYARGPFSGFPIKRYHLIFSKT